MKTHALRLKHTVKKVCDFLLWDQWTSDEKVKKETPLFSLKIRSESLKEPHM
jgi:hypothetical protein